MKFLLAAVNAKYIHSNPAVHSLKAYAGAVWKDRIEIAEYTINQRAEQIRADLYRRRPDVIAFSCYIWNIELILEIAAELHKLLPDMPIWLGGPEVSYEPQLVLCRLPFAAGIMVGEGEETFRELLSYYTYYCEETFHNEKALPPSQRKTSEPAGFHAAKSRTVRLCEIPGLYLPDTGYTQARTCLPMDELPFFYRTKGEERETDVSVCDALCENSTLDNSILDNRILYYESSRGCPFQCSYCLSSIHEAEQRVRLRSLSLVLEDLQFFLDRKVKQVKFVDRTFNCNKEHAIGIWQYLIENDNGVTNFHFEIAADILDEEELRLLAGSRPGLFQLEIGVQSTNERTLEAIRRRMDLAKLERNVSILRAGNNIHLHLDLIAGLPYEDYESFGRSFDAVYAMKPEQLQLGFLKVLKGSRMYAEAESYGICYTERAPYEVLYTDYLTYDEVLRLKRIEEMAELYYNSGQFTHVLPVLEKVFKRPFALYEALADFYEEQGYFVTAPARSYRYQTLLAFAERYDSAYDKLYRELCLFDLYLRENLKSRPDFAPPSKLYYNEILDFYKEEEKKPTYLSEYVGMTAKQLMKQTHLELFSYPVWLPEQCREVEPKDGAYAVLFDYRNRNPLNHDAAYYTWEIV